ncbi:MAG: hypothetical protein RR337_06010, partial [Clostridia bacterium]
MITRFYVTTRGKKLYAKWQTGAIPAFTRIQVGKGTIPDGISPESVTALYDAVKFIPISGESISGSTANIAAQFSNEGVIAAFDWKEIGLFATDPNDGEILYGYGYDLINPTNIPSYATSPVSFIYTMQLTIGNATEITIVVDPATAYATKAELSEALSGKAAVSHAHAQADVTGLTTALAGKVDKVTGKTLSTNDLTDALKTNYDKAHTHALAAHAPADANNYVHPAYSAAAAAL